MEVNVKKRSQKEFQDLLVQQIISKYGKPAPPPQNYPINHCSCYSNNLKNKWCALSHIQKTKRICLDCPYQPFLCQVVEQDCHSVWQKTDSVDIKKSWMKCNRRTTVSHSSANTSSSMKKGCPKGSKEEKTMKLS